jgi:hypothetical protein
VGKDTIKRRRSNNDGENIDNGKRWKSLGLSPQAPDCDIGQKAYYPPGKVDPSFRVLIQPASRQGPSCKLWVLVNFVGEE